jgi:hypothetical protein
VAVEAIFEGVDGFLSALSGIVARADAAGREIVTKGGHAIEAATKANMNGRPGPNVQTGTLRRSVTVSDARRLGPGAWQTETAPTTVYGRRIELGFTGSDSLGRHFNQPPYPSLGPGVRDAAPVLAAIYRAAWSAAMRI